MTQGGKFLLDTTGIISSEAVAGEVRVKIGNPAATDGGEGEDAPVWGVDGFISRPNPPNSNGECALAMRAQLGYQKHIIATKDARFVDAVGQLNPGDRAVVTDADARWFLKRDESAVVSFTVNRKTDDSMICDINGKDGEIRIFNGTVGILMRNDDNGKSLILTTGATTILLDEDGMFINGAHLGCNTNGGNFGTLGPVPPVQPAFSVLVGPSGMTAVPSTKWTMAV